MAGLQEEPADLEGAYVVALSELAVGDFDSEVTRAYNRSFAAKAERQEGDTAGERRRAEHLKAGVLQGCTQRGLLQ